MTKDGRTTHLAVGAGFVQVEGDLVSVLAEHAIREEEIDETAVEQAIARAEEALKNKDTLEPSEIDRLEAVFRFSLAQLGVKRRRR